MKIKVYLKDGTILEKDQFCTTIVKTFTGPLGVLIFDEEWCAIWDQELAFDVPQPFHYAVKTERLYDYLVGKVAEMGTSDIVEVESVEFR